MATELRKDGPKFSKGMKIFHALTQRPVEVLSVKTGSLVFSYDVKEKRGVAFDAMEGELMFPPQPKEKKRRRWSDDDEDEGKDNSRDARDRDRD